MPMVYTTVLEFESDDDMRRAYDYAKPFIDTLNADRPEGLKIELDRWSDAGKAFFGFHGPSSFNEEGFCWSDIPALMAVEFPEMPFNVTVTSSTADHWWARNVDGVLLPVDHYEEILEMIFRWYIDVEDPFAGPTEENWAEMRRCREQRVQEMIDLGVDIAPGTWPPSGEQFEQEYRFRYKLEHGHFPTESSDDNELPF